MFPDGKDKIEYTSSIRKEFILTKFYICYFKYK